MPQYFFDTSALVKYYHAETGTPAVSAIFAESNRQVRISILGLLEIQSAFAMKVRAGVIDRAASGILRARLMADIAAGEIEVYKLLPEHFASAERLIARHGFTLRLRTLDALQLAVALDLLAQGLIDHFVAADLTLIEIARREGLNVINPLAC